MEEVEMKMGSMIFSFVLDFGLISLSKMQTNLHFVALSLGQLIAQN